MPAPRASFFRSCRVALVLPALALVSCRDNSAPGSAAAADTMPVATTKPADPEPIPPPASQLPSLAELRQRADQPPRSDASYVDSDEDALPDVLEHAFGTDPHKSDTDGDGLLDGLEEPEGFDPRIPDYVGLDITPPRPPMGLRLEEITPNTVTLQWNPMADPGGAVEFEIWRNDLLVGRTFETTFKDNYGFEGIYPFTYHLTARDTEHNSSEPSYRIIGSTVAGFHPLPGDADGDGMKDEGDPEPHDPANAFRDDDGDAIANRDDPEPNKYAGPPPRVEIISIR